ncbi:RNA 2',3'-cyclic phosphodiesterase [Nonomuraea africana]|uniref:RNA 2',3'-cyclic phosphodiesterase n=1 Tax=Nonomuraea africana TaxID=46171 RepID=A0ABR9KP13_9ACTN|nr:RNA 2',3'-cyclic phosphodiesterase [Nonomuraea africana]MBE1563763.1 2'-5' RNA ligase [Nonomuraea africana]
MRLFAAILPPPEILDEVAAALAPRIRVVEGLRWVDRSTWHLTLAFYGEVADRSLPDLEVRLARAAARHPVKRLAFAGAGAFAKRVFWVGITGDPLVRLADSAAAAGRRAGAVQTDEKRFHAHLTLARARHPTDLRPLVEALSSFAGSPWWADSIHLMRSHPGSAVRYESLGHWALAPAERS